MLLNSLVQMLQKELHTWLCGFGRLWLMIRQDLSSSHSLSVSKSHNRSHTHSVTNSHSHSIKTGPRIILGWLLQGSVISLLDLSHSRC